MVSELHTGLYTATSTNPNRNLNPNTASRGGGCYSSVDGLTCFHKGLHVHVINRVPQCATLTSGRNGKHIDYPI